MSEEQHSGDGAEQAHEARECMPCAGSGQVISNLGGSPVKVSCPWCEGSGVRRPGIDAQVRWEDAAPKPGTPDAQAPEAQASAS